MRSSDSPYGPGTTTGITIYGCDPDEVALFTEMAPRLGVRPSFVAAPVSEANVDLAVGNRCISIDHKARVTGATLQALSRAGVRHISTRSIGCNHLDVEHAATLGMTVGTVAYSPDSVADYTLMLTLMVLRDAKALVRRADVHDYRLPERRGRELRDLTIGVVGTGRIGSAVITRLRGFGCSVLAHDSRPTADAPHVTLEELLRHSDVVTLHTPLTPDTHHLLDRERLAHLKPGAYVVNTGRGDLIDTGALLSALEDGRLGGAALDVVEDEEGTFYADCRGRPVDATLARLQRLPNVVVSPHTAFYTEHALSDIVENTLRDCLGRGGEQRG